MLTVLLIAASIAGGPVTVECDAAKNNPFPFPVDGWARQSTREIHLDGFLCDALERHNTRDMTFARALGVLIHEASHVRGVRKEACAELYANVLIYDVLRTHYGVPFHSPGSIRMGKWAVMWNWLRPPSYRAEADSCDLEP